MNEPFDPLEAELRSLRPVQISSDAQMRIAQQLQPAQPAKPPRSRRLASWAAPLIGLAAACLIASWLLRPQAPPQRPASAGPNAFDQSLSAAFDEAAPSVWSYRQALIRSPAAAEALLDKHTASRPASIQTPAHFFTYADREILLKGEL